MSGTFKTPDLVVTGQGCLSELGTHASRLGSHALLVTGKSSMQRHGFLDQAINDLKYHNLRVTVSDGVEHDPSLATVDRIRSTCRQEQCDLVIGLGGGSAIDAAKAVAGLLDQDAPTCEFFDGKPIPGNTVPVIAIPSTFGTGTETTSVSVLSDPERLLKKSIRHDCMLPKVALVDPLLGVPAPPRLTAACGLDALTQAIESYLSIHATSLTQSMSFSASVLLCSALPRAVKNGDDLDAREDCANASTMAGIALYNARLGLVHGLAHPLGIRYGIAHGEICGTLLPHVLRFNREANESAYSVLCGIVGSDIADFCENLLQFCGLPVDLRHLNIPESEFATLADLTLPSGSTKANPRTVTKDDVIDLLRSLCLPATS